LLAIVFYVNGSFTAYRGQPVRYLAKLDAQSGDLDTAFTANHTLSASLAALVTDGDKLILGGLFRGYGGVPAPGFAWLDEPSLSPHPGFDGGFASGSRVNTLTATDDAIFAGGVFSTYQGHTINNLAKLSPVDGSADTSFAGGVGLQWPG